jgi:hypothetical protein
MDYGGVLLYKVVRVGSISYAFCTITMCIGTLTCKHKVWPMYMGDLYYQNN